MKSTKSSGKSDRERKILQSKYLSSGKIRLHYTEGPPNGPPLILLHGISVRWQSFLPIIPFLLPRRHIFALDFRGHGESGRADGSYAVDDYATDVSALIAQRIKETPIIFGHSLGGMVAMRVAAKVSVKALVIGDSPMFSETIRSRVSKTPSMKQLAGDSFSVNELAALLSKRFPGADPAFYRYWAQSRRKVDPEALKAFEQWFLQYDCTDDLTKITCPVMLLQSDWICDNDVARAKELSPDIIALKFENLSHELHNESRGYKVVAPILQFLESLE
ncbi:MAG: alpha/beta fold hydrolase [Chitinivibrionales bacterium]|nr:alpha/beta fold hydrolase [Chitinivibrionales bacterium]